MQSRLPLEPAALKLIGSLKFDPGYLLLLDALQADLDNLTDELGNPSLPAEQAQSKLRHWQAFREILQYLRTTPGNYLAQAQEELKDEPPAIEENHWLMAQRYLQDAFEHHE